MLIFPAEILGGIGTRVVGKTVDVLGSDVEVVGRVKRPGGHMDLAGALVVVKGAGSRWIARLKMGFS